MARWKTFRRQKREWIKFAAACREGEDNSKRNPIARVSRKKNTSIHLCEYLCEGSFAKDRLIKAETFKNLYA